MSSQEARALVAAGADTQRLLALDELWTNGLRSMAGEDDRATVVAIGMEMREILARLRHEAHWLSSVVLRDRMAFESAAAEVVAGLPLAPEAKARIAKHFEELGWAAEAEIAFRHISDSDAIDEELSRKLSDLAEGDAPNPDLPGWFRCALYIGVAAAAIGVALAAGGASLVLGLAVLGPVMQAGLNLDDWRDKNRSPSEAKQITRLLEIRADGDISEERFREKCRPDSGARSKHPFGPTSNATSGGGRDVDRHAALPASPFARRRSSESPPPRPRAVRTCA